MERPDLGGRRRVGFLEERPDPRPDVLPAAELAVLVRVFETEPLHDVLLGELIGVEVETVEDLERLLRVAMSRVRHPAARLHLVGVQTPEVQLLLEQRAAHVGRVVQLPGPIIVEYLSRDDTQHAPHRWSDSVTEVPIQFIIIIIIIITVY